MTYGTIDSCLSRASTGNPSHQLGNPSACWQVTCFCALSTRQRVNVWSLLPSVPPPTSPGTAPQCPPSQPRPTTGCFRHPWVCQNLQGLTTMLTETDPPSSREFEGPSYNTKSSSPSANSRGIPRPCCFQERGEDYGLG
jgi:hypothetical protein